MITTYTNQYELQKYVKEYNTLNDLANTRTDLQYNTQGPLTIRTMAKLQWTIQILD